MNLKRGVKGKLSEKLELEWLEDNEFTLFLFLIDLLFLYICKLILFLFLFHLPKFTYINILI
jgi:hypothetical protein